MGLNLKFFVPDVTSVISKTSENFFSSQYHKDVLLSVHSSCLMLRIGLTQCLMNQNIYGSELKWLNLSAVSSRVHTRAGSST